MFSFEEIVKKILDETEIKEDELNKMIEEKEDELSGLVSKEGAAYIVGRELGVDLIKEGKKELKIKNLVTGLRNADLVAKVVRIFEKREWEKDNNKGVVLSMIVGDETGTTRLTLWNDQVKRIEKEGIKEGDVIRISKTFVKEGINGPELSLGKHGTVDKLDEDISIEDISIEGNFSGSSERQEIRYERKNIDELEDNSFCEVKACLVNLFDRDPFFVKCKECGNSIEKKENSYICKTHGEVEPQYNLILSGVLDDGTETIRAVFFKEVAEKVLGKSTEEVKNDPDCIKNFDGLGKDFIIKGKIKKSDFSGELEIIVNSVEEVDPKKECERLL